MKLSEIVSSLGCRTITKSTDFDSIEISNVAASDLMSDILVTDKDNLLIVTSLTSDQVIRTADIVGALGILIINNKPPQESLKRLAGDTNLTLLSTKLSCFEVCVALGKLLGV